MKKFLFAVCASAGLAAYAGDVANSQCAWSLSGYACESRAIVAVAEVEMPVVRSRV